MGLLQIAGAHEPARILDAEQLLFHPVRVHARRGHDDERCIRPPAPTVEHARRYLLADPGRSRDQDATARPGHLLDGRADSVDRGRCAGQFIILPETRPQHLIFSPQPLRFGGARNQMEQAVGLERLFYEIGRAFSDGRYGSVDIPVPGNHQHRNSGVAPLDLVQ